MDATRAMKLTDVMTQGLKHTHRVCELTLGSKASNIWRVRSKVRGFARPMGFKEDALDDIIIAVGEASTNAVKHGTSLGDPPIRIRLENTDDVLTVTIADAGPGFDPAKVCPPCEDDLCECGRGIMCMRSLMDEVTFTRLNPGMQVRMVKRVSV